MAESRRNFLTKLGIGSLVFTTSGLFKIKQDIPLTMETEPNKVKYELEELPKEDIIELANALLNVMDGKIAGKYGELMKQALNKNFGNSVYKF